MKGVRRGCVRLKGAVIGIDDQDSNTFTITVDHKTFHFQAKDGEEREKWVRRLEDTILRHARNRPLWSSDQYCSSPAELSKRSNYLQTLDKRISEADAYLQLMIEQTNKIETKLAAVTAEKQSVPSDTASTSEAAGAGGDSENSLKLLQESANAMLESFKHSIVLLQIAKNTAHPINGVYQGPSSQMIAGRKKTVSDSLDRTPDSVDMVLVGSSSLPTPHVEFGIECSEKKLSDNVGAASMQLHVPETSYSSSEGEDDFYDATENPYSSSASLKGVEDDDDSDGRSNAIVPKSNPMSQRNSLITAVRNDGSLDYDAMYEDDSEHDLSMESHGSVVKFLLQLPLVRLLQFTIFIPR